jgi:hypothetical protein
MIEKSDTPVSGRSTTEEGRQRRPWRTPHVILSNIALTDNGATNMTDAGATMGTPHS